MKHQKRKQKPPVKTPPKIPTPQLPVRPPERPPERQPEHHHHAAKELQEKFMSDHTDKALLAVACALNEMVALQRNEFEWRRSHHGLATKQDLIEMEKRIMSAVSTFLTSQKAFNEQQAAAVDSVVQSIAGVTADVAELNRLIGVLQSSAGEFTAEDQVTADDLQAKSEALTGKLAAASTALAELDKATPPRIPSV